MKQNTYRRTWLIALACLVALCAYPLYMGARVIADMAKYGAVPLENYPKYVIPYTPIALSLIIGVALIPPIQKRLKRTDFLAGVALALVIFYIAERLMETQILVKAEGAVQLESWQMALCYNPPDQYATRTWEAVDVLLGGYSPAFKLHFYLISAVLIVSILNCFYGFMRMLRSGDFSRKKPLILQSVASASFLIMCIWACFTAFYRSGELFVSALSAVLMSVFFTLLGVTMGVFAGSYTLGKRRLFAVWLPAAIASATTLLMYIGEMILLSGNLYRFGTGFFFSGLGALALAPVDIAVILLSGGVTALVFALINKKPAKE